MINTTNAKYHNTFTRFKTPLKRRNNSKPINNRVIQTAKPYWTNNKQLKYNPIKNKTNK